VLRPAKVASASGQPPEGRRGVSICLVALSSFSYVTQTAMLSLSSVSLLSAASRSISSVLRRTWSQPTPALSFFARSRHQLAPRRVQFIKRHKGNIPIPIGGSVKGTTLAYGIWGLRIKGPGVRLTAKQLTTAEEVIKRKIKVVKGCKVYLRVFPDIPVCIKVRA
jgi:Ribosomal protein L16p/L10e